MRDEDGRTLVWFCWQKSYLLKLDQLAKNKYWIIPVMDEWVTKKDKLFSFKFFEVLKFETALKKCLSQWHSRLWK